MDSHDSRFELSPREYEIVRLASEGHTDQSIAHHLGIGEGTVKTYWNRVRAKIGPYARPEIIARVVRHEAEAVLENLRHQVRCLQAEVHEADRVDDATRAILEAPDAILIVRTDRQIELANDEAALLFGFSRTELERMDLDDLVPRRFRSSHRGLVATFLSDPHRIQMGTHQSTPALHASGVEFEVHASLGPIGSSEGLRVMCIVRRASE
ncbi:MAG TPA: PAS domain S-box protein [Fimbriimonadaceae bacterium]|nr:PAS domain S-box protein [Fimbriimonadaceae bacterium]